jgi:hypothetical protein
VEPFLPLFLRVHKALAAVVVVVEVGLIVVWEGFSTGLVIMGARHQQQQQQQLEQASLLKVRCGCA